MCAWIGSKARLATPTELRHYQSLAKSAPKNLALSEARFVVFDSETSGLDPQRDHILSIAAVGVSNFRINLGDSFEVKIAQSYVGGRQAVSIHGLVPQELHQGFTETEAVLKFISYIGSATLVAHHARFDLAMVNRVLRPLSRAKIINPWIDTSLLLHRLDHGPWSNRVEPPPSLDTALEKFQIELNDRHTAAGDTLATATLFIQLLKIAQKRGIQSIRSLIQR